MREQLWRVRMLLRRAWCRCFHRAVWRPGTCWLGRGRWCARCGWWAPLFEPVTTGYAAVVTAGGWNKTQGNIEYLRGGR